MGQERLNHLMILHAHKSRTDKLNVIDIANDFVSKSERRLTIIASLGKVNVKNRLNA